MKIVYIIIILISLLDHCHSYAEQPEKETLVLVSREVGFFSVFMDVIHCLHAYDQKQIKGLLIDFGAKGLYYDPALGSNWWNYYFEPIALGDLSPPIRQIEISSEFNLKLHNPYQEHQEVISKYVILKSHIRHYIDDFVRKNFATYTIGVHYRGTDKYTEVPRVNYAKFIDALRGIIPKKDTGNFKLFVATDEQAFLDEVIRLFPNRVCYINTPRAKDINVPLHLDPRRDPYQCGESALIDCLLLSRTKLLIRTESNLSECARYFNAALPTIIISNN